MWSCVSVVEGAKEASGFTRSALRVRRKDEALRRQEKQIHSVALAEERMDGRNEPLSDWNAIVVVCWAATMIFWVSFPSALASRRCYSAALLWLLEIAAPSPFDEGI